jgi:predicted DNA-binding transcriptional regulator AlpA
MTAHSPSGDDIELLMKSNETAAFLRVSESWLAKARMRGEGPPFVQIGRSVRYSKAAVLRWLKSQER